MKRCVSSSNAKRYYSAQKTMAKKLSRLQQKNIVKEVNNVQIPIKVSNSLMP